MTTALQERVDRLEQTVDHMATEVVKPLQDRVKQLETWAGPGQNEGFSANLVGIRKSLTALSDGQAVLRGMLIENTRILGGHTETLDQHTDILAGQAKTLNQHTDILTEHTEILAGHTETLTKHGNTLDKHTGMLNQQSQMLSKHGETLDNHTGILDNHTELLSEILFRLPPRPEQPAEQPSRM